MGEPRPYIQQLIPFMILASVSEIKSQLSSYLKKAIAGEQVIICSYNTPIVELKAISTDHSAVKRKFGTAKGLVKIGKNFNAPLKDFEKSFYNKNLIS